MKKIIRYSFIAAIAAVSFSSCKKDEKTKMELITEGNWKLISDQEIIGTGEWQEYITSYEACERDNYLKFSSNNIVEANEGATQCDAGDPPSTSGPWSFVNGETQINIYGYVGNLDELSASRMTISTTETVGTITYYSRQTYSH
jgi:hypothetical protein